jgi:Raf kinase inhibitor-like YbhB/YbcL family protein
LKTSRLQLFCLFILACVLAACTNLPALTLTPQEAPMALSLSSSAFDPGKPIPDEFTCKGRNISPALAWAGAPSGTVSFALIVDDPDAPSGSFVHWVIYNIPAASQGLAQAVPQQTTLDNGSAQGRNGAGQQYYFGPCPPSGTHRYFFKLFALDTRLDLPAGATADKLTAAMQGHILAQGELMGTASK